MGNSGQIILAGILAVCFSSCRQGGRETVTAPESEFRPVRLHYENSGGEIATTLYYYDRTGNNYMAIWHLEDSSRSSLNHHVLDTAGRILVKSRDFNDGIRSLQHFEYDREGNLVFEDFSRSDSVTGEVSYEYDREGRLTRADCRGMNGWFHGKIVYNWVDGQKTGADLMRDSVSIGRIDYEYEDDRLIEEHWDFNGNWEQTFRYDYQQSASPTFASPNVFIRESPWFRISSEYYEYNGEAGGPSIYTYDEIGAMTNKEYIRSDGLKTMSTYLYDTAGLPESSLREYADGRTMDFLYWYSVDRKLLVKTFQGSDGTSGSETYRYEDDKLVQGEFMNVDGWLNGTLTFEHDDQGVLRSAVFSGQNGFDAGLEFSYDLNFNLVKIHWEFSSGHTQTYFFEYEPINDPGNDRIRF
jgi:hypothetical protein